MAAKKILTGCLVVVLLLAIGAGAIFWFVLRPMWNAGSEAVNYAKEWASTADLGEGIANQAAFEPPADGRLTPAQVEALVAVQAEVAREMGDDLARMGERLRRAQSTGGEQSLADVASAYREASGLMQRFREAQARGVNAVGMSRGEYGWVRRQALAAMPLLADVANVPGMPGVPGFPALSGDAPEGDAGRAAARHNADLLRPHLPLLNGTLGAGLPQLELPAGVPPIDPGTPDVEK